MKLILSAYLRTLRERDELDALLPDLLLEMGIVPLSKPQTGTRQFGVDLPAVGNDDDGRKKLFLFVLKQGDITRAVWDGSGPQSVQPSLNEIFDVYLRSHVPAKYKKLPVKIVLGTSGDLGEAVQGNWSGYTNSKSGRAEFDFWGADEIASLIERHMLNEHLFRSDDRSDLRRTLALIGEPDYPLDDFHRLLLRHLRLTREGKPEGKVPTVGELKKIIVRVNMATRMVVSWAVDEGDTRAALKSAERAMLWTWHRVNRAPKTQRKTLVQAFRGIFETYVAAAKSYLEKIAPYAVVRDGFCGHSRNSALLGLSVFEHIGFLSTIGLVAAYTKTDYTDTITSIDLAEIVDALTGLIKNNPVSGSPPLDENSVDVCLGLIFLTMLDSEPASHQWLSELVTRVDYTYRKTRNFPVGTDSLDDLVELHSSEPSSERRKELMATSWMLPTLAGWSVIFELPELYGRLASGEKEGGYPDVCRQLWHPTSSFYDSLYFRATRLNYGETEAPIIFETKLDDYQKKMSKIKSTDRYKITDQSPAYQSNLFGLDFVAYRHFRTPVPPSFWYQFWGLKTQILLLRNTW